MGKSKWFRPMAKPRNNLFPEKIFSKFLKLTAMASCLNLNQCKRPAYPQYLKTAAPLKP